MTRRELIWRGGKAGGYSAAFVTMRALGLLADAQVEPISLDFPCTVLEARDRPGGRNWTIRRRDTVEFVNRTLQQCAFDDGLYLNAGPGRATCRHGRRERPFRRSVLFR